MSLNRTELISRARDMVPTLRDRAFETEKLRRMPDETVRDFREAGFYRIFQPLRYGGYELDYGAQMEMAAELGRGCTSSAWDASITACHAWILGMFPAQAQEDVWGEDTGVLASTAFMGVDPGVQRIDGGIRINGRWKFSSGVDHCDWVILGMAVPPPAGDGPPERHLVLIPLTDAVVEDVWFMAGLSGTGSNDVVVADAFVPDHRFVNIMDLRGGPSPGSEHNPGYLFQLPLFSVFPYNILAPGFGAARGALEAVTEAVTERSSGMAHVKLSGLQSAHLRIAEAGAEIDAAYGLIMANCDEFNGLIKSGGSPTIRQRLRYRRDTAYAATVCVRAVERLFPLLGGRGLGLEDITQRAWRDVHAVAQHVGLTWDIHGSAFGANVVGLPPPDPTL